MPLFIFMFLVLHFFNTCPETAHKCPEVNPASLTKGIKLNFKCDLQKWPLSYHSASKDYPKTENLKFSSKIKTPALIKIKQPDRPQHTYPHGTSAEI